VYGKTVVSRRPGKQDPAKQSEARKKTRSNFKEASAWAKSVLRDPQRKEYYKQRAREWDLTNAYIAAIKDYIRNPVVTKHKALTVSLAKKNVLLHETRAEIINGNKKMRQPETHRQDINRQRKYADDSSHAMTYEKIRGERLRDSQHRLPHRDNQHELAFTSNPTSSGIRVATTRSLPYHARTGISAQWRRPLSQSSSCISISFQRTLIPPPS
jgi:hypothetical protein